MIAAECRKIVDGWLDDGSFTERLPEVAALRRVQQPEEFHAEGDAYDHTLLAARAVDDDADQRVFWEALLDRHIPSGTDRRLPHENNQPTVTIFFRERNVIASWNPTQQNRL